MGQVLHGSATTTHAVRAAIQRSKASIQELSARYGINTKTVQKWRKRGSVEDAPMGPKERRSRECQEFRVRGSMMGRKEIPHAPTQTACDC